MKILTVSALVCALMALTTADGESDIVKRSGNCPANWFGFNGRCFVYVKPPDTRTWDEAEEYCKSYNGHLASVHSLKEYRAVQGMVAKFTAVSSFPKAWLGGSYDRENAKFLWSDGSDFNWEGNWAPGQPDFIGNRPYCLMMNYGVRKEFASHPCKDTLPFFCAKNA